MHLHMYVLALLVALCTSSGGAEKCPASRTTSFTFSVASRRNVTGYWIVSMDAASEDSQLSKSREVAVDVVHSTVSCDQSELVRLNTTATVSPPAPTPVPPPGYEVVNALGYYKMHTTAMSWEDARDKCVQEGAHLIVINSDQEADVVRTYFTRKPKLQNATSESHTHVGFHDRYTEGQYVTVLGEPLASSGYTKWNPTEPTGGTSQNCGLANSNALLYDNPCFWKVFFICEYSTA